MKVKGIKIIFIFLILALILMPFPVYADTSIPVTYRTTQMQNDWQTHLRVTNYTENPNQSSVPSKLTFTLDDNYYGMIYFDGYCGSTLALNYQVVFIAGGVGEFNYRSFSNANPYYVNYVDIQLVNLVIPDAGVDLTMIEQLLTSMNSYEQSTDNSVSQILQAMLRHDIDVDSFNAWSFFFNYNWFDRDYQDPLATYWYQLQDPDFFNLPYPFMKVGVGENTTTGMVQLQPNLRLYPYGTEGQPHEYIFICWFASRMQINTSNWSTYFYSNNSDKFDIEADRLIASVSYYLDGTPTYLSLWKFRMKPNFTSSNYTAGMRMHGIWNDSITYGYISPVYSGSDLVEGSTGVDFALRYGLNNPVLNDLHTIAQGTSQSNQAASGLDSANTSMASDMNSMATIENGYSQDFNSQLQNIDFTNPIQQNQGILPAANFVISIFNGLISNNPFTVLIIIVCILLIGKKVIGK